MDWRPAARRLFRGGLGAGKTSALLNHAARLLTHGDKVLVLATDRRAFRATQLRLGDQLSLDTFSRCTVASVKDLVAQVFKETRTDDAIASPQRVEGALASAVVELSGTRFTPRQPALSVFNVSDTYHWLRATKSDASRYISALRDRGIARDSWDILALCESDSDMQVALAEYASVYHVIVDDAHLLCAAEHSAIRTIAEGSKSFWAAYAPEETISQRAREISAVCSSSWIEQVFADAESCVDLGRPQVPASTAFSFDNNDDEVRLIDAICTERQQRSKSLPFIVVRSRPLRQQWRETWNALVGQRLPLVEVGSTSLLDTREAKALAASLHAIADPQKYGAACYSAIVCCAGDAAGVVRYSHDHRVSFWHALEGTMTRGSHKHEKFYDALKTEATNIANVCTDGDLSESTMLDAAQRLLQAAGGEGVLDGDLVASCIDQMQGLDEGAPVSPSALAQRMCARLRKGRVWRAGGPIRASAPSADLLFSECGEAMEAFPIICSAFDALDIGMHVDLPEIVVLPCHGQGMWPARFRRSFAWAPLSTERARQACHDSEHALRARMSSLAREQVIYTMSRSYPWRTRDVEPAEGLVWQHVQRANAGASRAGSSMNAVPRSPDASLLHPRSASDAGKDLRLSPMSYSRARAYDTCPLRFAFTSAACGSLAVESSLDGASWAWRRGSASPEALALGSALHSGAEAVTNTLTSEPYVDTDRLECEAGLAMQQRICDASLRPQVIADAVAREAQRAVPSVVAAARAARRDGYAWAEVKFDVALENVPVRGIIDLVVAPAEIGDGRWRTIASLLGKDMGMGLAQSDSGIPSRHGHLVPLRIVDFKSSLASVDTLQPVLYALALDTLLHNVAYVESASFVDMWTGREREVNIHEPAARKSALHLVTSAAYGAALANFAPRPRAPSCSTCQFRALCPHSAV